MILLLDLNGTIALDGKVIDGVKDRLKILKNNNYKVYILSADTQGTLEEIAKDLGVEKIKISGKEGEAKLKVLRELKSKYKGKIIAIGNGKNDRFMLKEADLGICVIGEEGAYVETLMNADIVVNNILNALDLLIYDKRLRATIRD
ncbi:HAD family hydrolase [Methanocaldococcus sp.]